MHAVSVAARSARGPYNPQVARETTGTKLIAENRRSRHDYELLERVEAGIVLSGTEVKALRAGHVQLGQAFADVRNGEMWLDRRLDLGVRPGQHLEPHHGSRPEAAAQAERDRRLYAKVREKGLTLVPTKLYFKDGKVKVEVALGRGKDKGDKRRTIADRDAKRQMERALKARR